MLNKFYMLHKRMKMESWVSKDHLLQLGTEEYVFLRFSMIFSSHCDLVTQALRPKKQTSKLSVEE